MSDDVSDLSSVSTELKALASIVVVNNSNVSLSLKEIPVWMSL